MSRPRKNSRRPLKRPLPRTNADREAAKLRLLILDEMALGAYGEDTQVLALQLLKARESFIHLNPQRTVNKLKKRCS